MPTGVIIFTSLCNGWLLRCMFIASVFSSIRCISALSLPLFLAKISHNHSFISSCKNNMLAYCNFGHFKHSAASAKKFQSTICNKGYSTLSESSIMSHFHWVSVFFMFCGTWVKMARNPSILDNFSNCHRVTVCGNFNLPSVSYRVFILSIAHTAFATSCTVSNLCAGVSVSLTRHPPAS